MVEHEAADARGECPIRERQRHRVRLHEFHAGVPAPGLAQHPRRHIDACRLRAASGCRAGDHARPASEVEHPHPRADAGGVEERLGERRRDPGGQAVVGACTLAPAGSLEGGEAALGVGRVSHVGSPRDSRGARPPASIGPEPGSTARAPGRSPTPHPGRLRDRARGAGGLRAPRDRSRRGRADDGARARDLRLGKRVLTILRVRRIRRKVALNRTFFPSRSGCLCARILPSAHLVWDGRGMRSPAGRCRRIFLSNLGASASCSIDHLPSAVRRAEPREALAAEAEAEAGYDVDRLIARRTKRGRPALGSSPASVESVRLDPELRQEASSAPARREPRPRRTSARRFGASCAPRDQPTACPAPPGLALRAASGCSQGVSPRGTPRAAVAAGGQRGELRTGAVDVSRRPQPRSAVVSVPGRRSAPDSPVSRRRMRALALCTPAWEMR